ncbi:hypothetical protein [Nocardia nepalensis]|uniref:hypothetical protein n=1 Tax=Nocardia nepalensis TaxID=3375448 RepID=UPI003B676CCA
MIDGVRAARTVLAALRVRRAVFGQQGGQTALFTAALDTPTHAIDAVATGTPPHLECGVTVAGRWSPNV